MDELTIDDKKYISSKQAAKITGYAKDYVGQLCREGYVEARRVGRNWYVLESAIKDHRFGTTHAQAAATPVAKSVATITPTPRPTTWQAPRYEAVKPMELPSINLLRPDDATPVEAPVSRVETPQRPTEDFHQAWQTWFDTFRTGEEHAPETGGEGLVLMPMEESHHDEPASPSTSQYDEAPVPIRVLPQEPPKYSIGPHTAPRAGIIETRVEDVMAKHYGLPRADFAPKSPLRMAIYAVSVLIVVAALGVTALGTGKFDKTIISDSRASAISGMTVYKKI